MRWIDEINCDAKACGIRNWRMVAFGLQKFEEVTKGGQHNSAMSCRAGDDDSANSKTNLT